MNETTSLITLFNPQPIYDSGAALARAIYLTVSPVLLVVAIFIRTMETQLDVVAGQGRWTVAIRDFLGWGLVLSIYFGLANLVAQFMNAVFIWMDSFGSLKAIGDNLAALSETLKDKAANQVAQGNVLELVLSGTAQLPSMLVSFACYYLSLLLVTALSIFLKIAHALGYSIGVAYGLIAIPLAITRSFRLLRGWAVFMGFLLLWPVVLAFAVGLFTPLFAKASQTLIQNPSISVGSATFGTYMFFTVLHLVVAAILVASPFIAGSLAANAPVHAGLVTPFATAAVAAGGMLFKSRINTSTGGSKPAASQANGAASSGPRPAADASGPRPRALPSSAPAPTPAPTPASTPALSPSAAASPATPVLKPTVSAPAAPSPEAQAEAQRLARKQRKGAILTQQRKSRQA